MRIFPRLDLRQEKGRTRYSRRRPKLPRAKFSPLVWALLAGGALLLTALVRQWPIAYGTMAVTAITAIVAMHWLNRRQAVLQASPAGTVGPVPLLDLSQAMHRAKSVDSLYESLIAIVCQTFSAKDASLFIRDDSSGDFPCRVSTALASNGTKPSQTISLPALSRDAFVIRRLRNLSSPLQVEREELLNWEKAFRDAPPSVFEKRMCEQQTLQQTCSSLLVPLKTRNDMVGMLSLGERSVGRFGPRDREMLTGVGGQLALVVENTKLIERLVEHERLQAELALAAEVQRNLLPTAAPELPGLDLFGVCQPARQVGGDYYDFIPVDQGVLVCVADVAGKGISAALLMSVVQASLRGQLLDGQPRVGGLAAIVGNLNRLICGSISSSRFVTFFCAQVNQDGSLRYVNAGHNPPLLMTGGNGVAGTALRRLEAGGCVLGLFPDASFAEESLTLSQGDTLVAFTDGVTEALNAAEEEFTEERLCAILAEFRQRHARETLDAVIGSVTEWSKGTPQHDDITLVVMKRK